MSSRNFIWSSSAIVVQLACMFIKRCLAYALSTLHQCSTCGQPQHMMPFYIEGLTQTSLCDVVHCGCQQNALPQV